MKNNNQYKLFIITLVFLFCPLFFQGQSLTGLWIGSITNDSTSVRKDQSFEIALTEFKGKVYGYSRNEFIVNDTLYYIVKRVIGIIEGDVCEVTDEKIIAYNFQGKLDKKVKVTSTFRRNQVDSTWYLDGKWKTKATKNYYSVSGKVNLGEEKDLTASKIFPHLEELKLATDVTFYNERKKEEEHIVKIVQPEKLQTASVAVVINGENTIKPEIKEPNIQLAKPAVTQASVEAPVKTTAEPTTANATLATTSSSGKDEKKKEKDVVVAKPTVVQSPTSALPGKENAESVAKNNSQPKALANIPSGISENKKPATDVVSATASNTKKKNETKPVIQPATQPATTSATTTVATVTETQTTKPVDPLALSRTTVMQTVIEKPKIKLTAADIKPKTVDIGGRKSEFSQAVLFSSDSLEIALYDNGEIDGDTVSVYMNGQMIMAHQGLKSSAIKKTIHFPASTDEFTLVMYAESLGRLPPNTGLLVIRDGEDVYHLRFSSDFQKSSGIVLRRNR